MRYFRYIFVLFIAACAAMTSCSKYEDTGKPEEGGEVDCPVVVSVAPMEAEIQTRSSIIEYDDSLRNFNIFVYDENGKLYRHSYEIIHAPLLTLKLEKNRRYTVLALANMGKEIVPFTDLNTMLLYTMDSVAISDMDSRYEPMAFRSELDVKEGTTLHINLERLPSRLNLKFDCSGLKDADSSFYITKVALRQCHSRCYPFAAKGDPNRRAWERKYVHNGDSAEWKNLLNPPQDIVDLNAGKFISLYMFENEQQQDPGITNPWDKVPGKISSEIDTTLCTYLEFQGYWGTVTAFWNYKFLSGRMYLGKNSTSDFNVTRNSSDTLVVKLTKEGLKKKSWKVIQGF